MKGNRKYNAGDKVLWGNEEAIIIKEDNVDEHGDYRGEIHYACKLDDSGDEYILPARELTSF